MSKWIEYTGSDKQIEEIRNAEHGFIVSKDGQESRWFCHGYTAAYVEKHLSAFTHYLVCNPHHLADMICQQARTGQPVYCKKAIEVGHEREHQYFTQTERINWDIPGAQYSFTPFEDK